MIDNRWFPLTPGVRMVWTGHAYDDDQRVARKIEMTVTDLTKQIAGVRTRVARERDFTDGEAEEVELTFYAQDDYGTVWYFGEYSEEYDDGQLVKSPLWLAGLARARAGIMMPAAPAEGTPDFAEGLGPAVQWNDRARVDRVRVTTRVPAGRYRDVVVMDEFNPDEPGRHQLKYYAPGVGNVRTDWRGKQEEEREKLQLVTREHLDRAQLADLDADARDQEKRAYQRSPETYGKTEPMTKS